MKTLKTIIVLILLAATTVQAETLCGTTTDLANGYPVANVTISFMTGESTHTNSHGQYCIDIQAGVYDITFSKNNYETFLVENFQVIANQDNNLNIELNTPGDLNITTESLPVGWQHTPYNARVRIKGGARPFKYTIVQGDLPDGLELDENYGNIHGNPNNIGAQTFRVRVTDARGNISEREFTIRITEILEIITPMSLPGGTRGKDYQASIYAKGGTSPYTFSLKTGQLPEPFTFTPNGLLSGYASDIGTYNFVIQVTDSDGATVDKLFHLEIIHPLSILTETLNNGIVGNAYNQSLLIEGGRAPFQWEAYSGRLPQGMILDTESGMLVGTPVEPTFGTLVVSVTDVDGRVAFRNYLLHVVDPLEIITKSLPKARINDDYSEFIRVRGGHGPFTFLISDDLPEGLNFNAQTGAISGIPVVEGLFNITVSVVDNTYPSSQSNSLKFSIRITSDLTIITPSVLNNAQKNIVIEPISLVAAGGASPFLWSVVGGSLPEGISIDPDTGVIKGTPDDSGDVAFMIQVKDNNDQTAIKEFLWHIADDLEITTGGVPDGAKDVPYNFTLNADGGVEPYSWRIKSGTLLTGLEFDNETATIYGTPTQAGDIRTFTVECCDSDHPVRCTEKPYTFEVEHEDLFIFTLTLPNGRENKPYMEAIRARLGNPPYHFRVENGVLPKGLDLVETDSGAHIEGIPEKSGNYIFSIEVMDSDTPAAIARMEYSIDIYGDVTIQTQELKKACADQYYSESIVVSGGEYPYVWKIVKGFLPEGLSLNPKTGNISGIPHLIPGQHAQFTIRVNDSAHPYALDERDFMIYGIDCSLNILTTLLPKAMQKQHYSIQFQGEGGIAPYSWKISGNLPLGLQLNAETGELSGIVQTCNTFDFIVQMTDFAAIPSSVSRSFELEIVCANDYSIYGSINNADTIEIRVTGDTSFDITTDSTGSFVIDHLPNGVYVLSPHSDLYLIDPPTQSVIIENQDIVGILFNTQLKPQSGQLDITPQVQHTTAINGKVVFNINYTGTDSIVWTATTDVDWMSINPISSELNETLTVICQDNPSAERTGNIVISADNQAVTPVTVTIIQHQSTAEPKPQWEPALNQQNTMNIIAKLKIDDQWVTHEDTLLAAFVHEECRGIVGPEDGYFFLTVSSNEDSGETVVFKVWDPIQSNVLAVVDSIEFVSQKEIGTISEPYEFKTGMHQQTLSFGAGYTWFSVNTDPGDFSCKSMFSSLSLSENDRIIAQNSFAVYDGVKWMGSLKTIDPHNMYKMKLSTSQELIINGQAIKPADHSINLGEGYTWAGYLSHTVVDINTALQLMTPLPAINDRVQSQSMFAAYGENGWIGSLKQMTPGAGYIYKVSQNSQLTYGIVSSDTRKRQKTRNTSEEWIPVSHQQFNMNIIAVLKDSNGEILSNNQDVVAAFSGSECRGIGSPDPESNGLIFLTISSNNQSGETITFKAKISGQVLLVNEQIEFENQKEVGLLNAPWEILVKDSGPKDINDDGKINLKDVIMMLKYLTGFSGQ